MKILHTADWHVGRTLAGRSRFEEHEAVLAEICEVARREEVDLVLVAGDLFDSFSPSPEAERVVYNALLELGQLAPTVVVCGNHDNERRLSAVAPLFSLAEVVMRSFVSVEPLEIETRRGEPARIAVLPWLSQRFVVRADQLMGQDADELSGRYAERMRRVVAALTSGFEGSVVNLLCGHVTITGGALGGGERTAQTIFDYWVAPTVFHAGANYVALGHLHRMQRMPGACPIYYSGSPLQLDFSEGQDSKHVLVIEASAGLPARVEPVELRAGRRLRTVSGNLEELRAVAGTTGDDYLRVRVREPARAGLADDVRELFADAVVKVIVDAETEAAPTARGATQPGAAPRDLFALYLADRDIVDSRMVALFDRLYEELHETSAT